MVFIGPMPRFDVGKAVLHRCQDGQLPESLQLMELAALLAVTLEDPHGERGRYSMRNLLLGLVKDGLPVDKSNWSVRRADLIPFADRVQARLGALPLGFTSWAGSPAVVTTQIVGVTTKRLIELLEGACPTIRSLTRDFSRTPWLASCAIHEPDAKNHALRWDYWVTVEALRNRAMLVGDAPDPTAVVSTAPLHVLERQWGRR